MKKTFWLLFFVVLPCCLFSQQIQDSYVKLEKMIPMRDGVKLYTAIYVPKNNTERVPFLINRTPYSCNPYGENKYRQRLGPGRLFSNEPYIYVYQDVRGRYKSEGKFEEATPHVANKKTKNDVDESSDTYDTVEWLLKNIENNNATVGLYGISYPGFYAAAALPNAHPAIKAVSPQAPVTDEFEGDDAYHRGAFFLMDNFTFMNGFDYPRETPWTAYPAIADLKISNAYDFFLKLGPLKNANTQYFKNKSKIWNEYLQHDVKDAYWQKRNIRQHLTDVKPAVLVVGGWFDAEDLFGALNTYKAIEKGSPNNKSNLIMGPWTHGGWTRSNWNKYATFDFGSNTSEYFQKTEFAFFNYYLKGKGTYTASEATVFETGSNRWKTHTAWPPKNVRSQNWHLDNNKKLTLDKPGVAGVDEYVSDPANPVPYINTNGGSRNDDYMGADQRFASERRDVLSYESANLTEDITLAGPLTADLFVSMTGTDADFIVKLIDVLPDSAVGENGAAGGMQQLIRAEVLRGKFRNSFTTPEPFVPGKITRMQLQLNDVAHSFKKGHKIMIQIQSSWFPLVDRNPQKFMSIPKANEADFKAATIRIYHGAKYPSGLVVQRLEE